MKAGCTFALTISGLLLIALGLLYSTERVNAAAEGTITGTVKLNGTPPKMKTIDMSKDPVCVKAHANNPAHLENVVVDASGGLEYVVLYLSEGLPPAVANQVPSTPQKYDQKGCMYAPHVIGVDVDQKIEVTTSDPTTHNIHPLPRPGGPNIGWNKSQPPGAPPITTSWKAEEVAVPVKCNIHPWMHGYHAVVKGPYAVSDEKGSYTINNVPPGNYTVTAWQEEYGTQTQKVTVAAGKPATADFTFKAK
jgi:Carboxypeptidase regulatory-like domain